MFYLSSCLTQFHIVNGVFTVTFTGASFNPKGTQQELLEVNNFSWVDQYSVLLASKYVSGELVRFHPEYYVIQDIDEFLGQRRNRPEANCLWTRGRLQQRCTE